MLSAELTCFNACATKGQEDDDMVDNCINELGFDSENLIVQSRKDGKEVCTIIFSLDDQFMEELKMFIAALELRYRQERKFQSDQ